MRKLGCYDSLFAIVVFTILALASVGIHQSSSIKKYPCHIMSSPLDIVCYHIDLGNGPGYYIKYINYRVHIIESNITTLGSYNCARENNCQSPCLGNETLTVGALTQCYTTFLLQPDYDIVNTLIVEPVTVVLLISTIAMTTVIIVALIYLVLLLLAPNTEYVSLI